MDYVLLYLAPFQSFWLMTPPYTNFHPNFWGVPVAPHRPSKSIKLFGCEIILEVFPTYVITVPERYRRTGRFDRSRSSKVIDFDTNRKRY